MSGDPEDRAQEVLREAGERVAFEREIARVWRETYDQVLDVYGEEDER